MALFAPLDGSRDYAPLLKWILVNTLMVVGVLALWYFDVIQDVLSTDKTRISLVIFGVFLVTDLHCLAQTIFISRELIAARKVRDAIVDAGGKPLRILDDRIVTARGVTLDPGILNDHIGDLIAKARTVGDVHLDQTLLLRSLADQLKSREKLGWFVSEALLRLALLGTAVGFILMLIPISALDSFDVDSLRQTLTGMTEGMAIALNVTVAGIGTALLLKFLYYLLDEGIADLFRIATETTEVYVVPTLEPRVGSSAESAAREAWASRDDLKQITGLGPKMEERLNGLGVTRFAQIAAWTPDDVRKMDEELALSGRIERDGWVAQARALAGTGR